MQATGTRTVFQRRRISSSSASELELSALDRVTCVERQLRHTATTHSHTHGAASQCAKPLSVVEPSVDEGLLTESFSHSASGSAMDEADAFRSAHGLQVTVATGRRRLPAVFKGFRAVVSEAVQV